MLHSPRYAHTNPIARDWSLLAQFYIDLFGCKIVPPERDYSGAALEVGTGVPGASLSGLPPSLLSQSSRFDIIEANQTFIN
jgi:hypothetical protein